MKMGWTEVQSAICTGPNVAAMKYPLKKIQMGGNAENPYRLRNNW